MPRAFFVLPLFLALASSACSGAVCGECSESMVATMRRVRSGPQPEEKITRPEDAFVLANQATRTDGLGGETYLFSHTRYDGAIIVARIELEGTRDAWTEREVARIDKAPDHIGAALVRRGKDSVAISWEEPSFVGPAAVKVKAPKENHLLLTIAKPEGKGEATSCHARWPGETTALGEEDFRATCVRYHNLFNADPESDGTRTH